MKRELKIYALKSEIGSVLLELIEGAGTIPPEIFWTFAAIFTGSVCCE